MTIVVTGATGHLGRLIVESLLERGVPAADVVAVGRSVEKAAALAARGVRVVAADYADPASLDAAVAGADSVMLVSGSEIGQRALQHANVVAAAQRAGVSHFVYTSAPAADTSALVLAPEHKATEATIRESGIPFTILRNGWYTENYASQVEQAKATGAIVASVGDGRVASASRSDFADAAAVVLTTPGHAGATYELSGDVAWDYADLAAAASAVTGVEIAYTPVTPEQHAEILSGVGLDEGTTGFIVALDGNTRDGLLAATSGDLSRLIGRPTTPLQAGLAAALS